MQTFVDLFAGIGGFHVGLQRQGLRCVMACELDSVARDIYKANFGITPLSDVRGLGVCDIPKHDVLCAGFPCQPFSVAGNRKGASDPRGTLIYEVMRIARHALPAAVILENVKSVLGANGGRVRRYIYNELQDMGYIVTHAVLNAGEYGIPQQRVRCYFVALRRATTLVFTPPKPFSKPVLLRDVLRSDIDVEPLTVRRNNVVWTGDVNPKPAAKIIQVAYTGKDRQGERVYSPNGLAATMTANGGGPGGSTGMYYIDGRIRKLHISEAKRVMGFSDSHIVSEGRAGLQQLGNAVIPNMVELVFSAIDYPLSTD